MSQIASNIAEKASFQAFFNCYLKEVDAGDWSPASRWQMSVGRLGDVAKDKWIVEISLPHLAGKLAVNVEYRSLVGNHRFGKVLIQVDKFSWKVVSETHALQQLIEGIFHAKSAAFECKQELMLRVIESQRLMTQYIEERRGDPSLSKPNFIDAEQSLLFGHWQHPTPKSRQGMLEYHHAFYAPETKGRFPLHYFSIDHALIKQRSAIPLTAEEVITESLPAAADKPETHIVVPMHPLQAQWLLHQNDIRELIKAGDIKDLGSYGPEFTATSSVRSLYHPNLDWMYKFSLPVKITNSLRVNKRHELDAGVVMATLYRKTGFSERHACFKVITDPAYITVDLPGQEESGFEVIIRENPFPEGNDQDVVTIAALTQSPMPGESSMLYDVISKLANRNEADYLRIAIKWFAKYWECAIEPMIALYDEHGIALEAHQQNSVIEMKEGLPSVYYFRDNQGFYLSKAYRGYLETMEPDSVTVDSLYFDDDVICDRFAYYLFINHLFSVIGRMGADGLVEERILISFVQQRLYALRNNLSGAGKLFVERLLSESAIPVKANLLTRVHDVDELLADNEQAIYCTISNPLVMTCLEEPMEVSYASA
ncbi:N(2)-citryl-N(6)-acetyl-N(6)-hydroxylysine synthase [Grimontia celer]|uniref:N(2)-citryl-N(6)-acetyl-N(6)-hydroxylysine synthase n=1 Tax=Grimontia celer TaxID=1796497 RepID=A0A128FGL1_9GAMM|nr:IucA/IucC family protein [Grimontia celer]CZF85406.1 N(2)-citryl-N(6)-acetyl-N(6)-hydroxylysine synthase [Grimontia celer]